MTFLSDEKVEKHIIEERFVRTVDAVVSRSFGDGTADDEESEIKPQICPKFSRSRRPRPCADERDFPPETKPNGGDAINIPEASAIAAEEYTRLNFDPK